MEPTTNKNKYSSIEDALRVFATIGRQSSGDKTLYESDKKGIIHSMTAKIKEGNKLKSRQCYFVTDGTIKFHHEGCDTQMPDTVFLCDRQEASLIGKVLMFVSASGSGKTVELAGSAATRGADLAIVVSMEEDQDTEENNREMTKASMMLLKAKIEKVLEDTPVLHKLIDLTTLERPLKINVAIDKASTCPNLVRSIIAKPRLAFEAVVSALTGIQNKTGQMHVSFSVAGIGAYNDALGSSTPNFDILDPSARSLVPELCNHFLRNSAHCVFTGARLVTYKRIEEKFPVVATLMQNGRMASIAAKKLRESDEDELVEAKLVDSIVDSYMASNGMSTLIDDKSRGRMVAACAIAVHLFQWDKDKRGPTTPMNWKEFEAYMAEMQCGVEFRDDVEESVKQGHRNAMQTIVSQFGLLEPSIESSYLTPCSKPCDLFKMAPSQQLVALIMLGLRATDFVNAAPYGFESLSTHIMKCAIASSCVIQEECRPSLQHVLKKLGFKVDKHGTSEGIKGKWNDLSKYKAIPHSVTLQSRDESFEDDSDWTKQMKAELNRVCNEKGDCLLQICERAYGILTSMKVPVEGGGDHNDGELPTFLPSAFINYEDSPMPDGFVTFFCKNSSTSNVFKYTMMIQARCRCSRLNVLKMNEHARKCDDVLLNGVFGGEEHRLFCVAESGDHGAAEGPLQLKRNFITYASHWGEVLPKLLQVLERLTDTAIYCDSKGVEIDPQILQYETAKCQYETAKCQL